jgi:hypothetical protein
MQGEAIRETIAPGEGEGPVGIKCIHHIFHMHMGKGR